MNLFDQVRRKAPPIHEYEFEYMCSVDGDLHPSEAFDSDMDVRDEMCRECRGKEVERGRQEDNEA